MEVYSSVHSILTGETPIYTIASSVMTKFATPLAHVLSTVHISQMEPVFGFQLQPGETKHFEQIDIDRSRVKGQQVRQVVNITDFIGLVPLRPRPSHRWSYVEASSTITRPTQSLSLKITYCKKCRHHGLLRPKDSCRSITTPVWLGERLRCPHAACSCEKCESVNKCREINKRAQYKRKFRKHTKRPQYLGWR